MHINLEDARSFEVFREMMNYKNCFVYFISNGQAIKIGYAQDVDRRIFGLQTASHLELKLIGKISGGRIVEKYIHSLFEEKRIRGEWFEHCEEILNFIEESVKQDVYEELLVELPIPKISNNLFLSIGNLEETLNQIIIEDKPMAFADKELLSFLQENFLVEKGISFLNFRKMVTAFGFEVSTKYGLERMSCSPYGMCHILLNKSACDLLEKSSENIKYASSFIRGVLYQPKKVFTNSYDFK